MFRWLRKREHEKVVDIVSKRTAAIVADVDRLGFAVYEDEARVGEYNLKAKRFHTVGLPLLGLPELVSYGPVGGVQDVDLLKIVQYYLRMGAPMKPDAMPRHGDRIILEDKTLTLMAVSKNKFHDAIPQGLLALLDIYRRDKQFFPLAVMQVHAGNPPVRHWTREPTESRTLAVDQAYDPWKLSNLAAVIKKSQAELAPRF